MPVIFSTVNNLHVELFTLIYNMIYKNKAFQILYACQILLNQMNSFFFFLSSFKLDVFGICLRYKHTCLDRIQVDIMCVYISIQIQ